MDVNNSSRYTKSTFVAFILANKLFLSF